MKSTIISGLLLLSGTCYAQSAATPLNTERKEMKNEQPQQTQEKAVESNASLMSKDLKTVEKTETPLNEPKTKAKAEEKARRTERDPQY